MLCQVCQYVTLKIAVHDESMPNAFVCHVFSIWNMYKLHAKYSQKQVSKLNKCCFFFWKPHSHCSTHAHTHRVFLNINKTKKHMMMLMFCMKKQDLDKKIQHLHLQETFHFSHHSEYWINVRNFNLSKDTVFMFKSVLSFPCIRTKIIGCCSLKHKSAVMKSQIVGGAVTWVGLPFGMLISLSHALR